MTLKNALFSAVISLIAFACAGCMRDTHERMQMGWPYFDEEVEGKLLEKYRNKDFATLTPFDKEERNIIITELMFLVDQEYSRDREAIQWGRGHADFVTDVIVLGLNSAGAIVGGESIKSILAVTSAAVVGTEAAFNKAYFQDQTTKSLIAMMDSLRAEKE
ncbi:MAG: hypothetical protein L0Y44_16315, partial [Phycisphaerales bacterium]|nr:hypothetical protein [Phycisphaerales bacterium]